MLKKSNSTLEEGRRRKERNADRDFGFLKMRVIGNVAVLSVFHRPTEKEGKGWIITLKIGNCPEWHCRS